jgi:hypothetical protein
MSPTATLKGREQIPSRSVLDAAVRMLDEAATAEAQPVRNRLLGHGVTTFWVPVLVPGTLRLALMPRTSGPGGTAITFKPTFEGGWACPGREGKARSFC